MFHIWYSNSPEQTHIMTLSPSSLFASVFASSSYAYNANKMDCKIEIDQITACGINNSIQKKAITYSFNLTFQCFVFDILKMTVRIVNTFYV